MMHIPQELLFDHGFTVNIIPWSDGWAVFVYMARDGKVTTSPPPQPVLSEIPYGEIIPAPVDIAFRTNTVYAGAFSSFQDAVALLSGVFTQLSGPDKKEEAK